MGQCLGSQAHYNINNRNVVVKRRLGEGGFSYVELVHEAATSSIFAMKRMACTDDEELEAAKREIAMYQAFNHPNLIRVIDHDVVQSKVEPGAHEVCALFPAYQKGSLQDLIESHRADGSSIPEPMILRYVKDVCLALQHIHDHKPQGMCHRDVKPANVLLSDQDEPILMDFGSMTKIRTAMNGADCAMLTSGLCSFCYRAGCRSHQLPARGHPRTGQGCGTLFPSLSSTRTDRRGLAMHPGHKDRRVVHWCDALHLSVS
eukprot:TRINITY_DN9088_c0_g1_i5.p1 TRINITY_DN9088_c0_g1~~TRINITY_DN9088_c0_g1_i5.p1  ORF type:complete len:260 (+),score=12.58 TRINITY_DN9088_c0_g1_i5:644-1423(+)